MAGIEEELQAGFAEAIVTAYSRSDLPIPAFFLPDLTYQPELDTFTFRLQLDERVAQRRINARELLERGKGGDRPRYLEYMAAELIRFIEQERKEAAVKEAMVPGTLSRFEGIRFVDLKPGVINRIDTT